MSIAVDVWLGLVLLAFGAGALHHDPIPAHFMIASGAGLVSWAVARRHGKA